MTETIVEFNGPMKPPGDREPTKYLYADWVVREEDHYIFYFGDNTEWRISEKPVVNLKTNESPPSLWRFDYLKPA